MTDQPRDLRELPNRAREHEKQSEYPPPPGEEERDRQGEPTSRANMATTITLPSIHEQYPGQYGPPSAHRASYAGDPRASGAYSASPNSANGYPPPPGRTTYLPPLQPPADPRSPTYAPNPRDEYFRGQQPPPPGQYHQDQYYNSYNQGGPPPAGGYGPPSAYGAPQPGGYADYPGRVAGAVPPPIQQAAPRQRTSIACKYCRKRKVSTDWSRTFLRERTVSVFSIILLTRYSDSV
jgi:hypothetical protein